MKTITQQNFEEFFDSEIVESNKKNKIVENDDSDDPGVNCPKIGVVDLEVQVKPKLNTHKKQEELVPNSCAVVSELNSSNILSS